MRLNSRNRNLDTVLAARITTTSKNAHQPTVVALTAADPLVGFVLVDDPNAVGGAARLLMDHDVEVAVKPVLPDDVQHAVKQVCTEAAEAEAAQRRAAADTRALVAHLRDVSVPVFVLSQCRRMGVRAPGTVG